MKELETMIDVSWVEISCTRRIIDLAISLIEAEPTKEELEQAIAILNGGKAMIDKTDERYDAICKQLNEIE